MLHRLVFSTLVLASAHLPQALADSPQVNLFTSFLRDAPCGEQVRGSISRIVVNQAWFPVSVSEPRRPLAHGIAFRNTRSGVGYRLHSDAGSTTLTESRLSGEVITSSVFSRNFGCRPRIRDNPSTRSVTFASTRVDSNAFRDEDLFATLKQHAWGVIYVWSPSMPLSVAGIREVKAAMEAAKLRNGGEGGHLTILMDGRARPEQAQPLLDRNEVTAEEARPVASDELQARGLSLHYPVAFIYKDGLLANRTYAGHKPADVFARWIQLELAALDTSLASLRSQEAR